MAKDGAHERRPRYFTTPCLGVARATCIGGAGALTGGRGWRRELLATAREQVRSRSSVLCRERGNEVVSHAKGRR